uniref:Ribonuclease P protein component n=1 Tax=Candidatus Kentrum sp. FM TaxID=2126340 RepID=A0A450W124_9GAMM|nr:MAG: ribonuclease P protein component [Candidatus Kentron sp. FM]VFJ55918.1 MAG: ribonuclease P protein component [Candidatus Kentron sp. FM]VFK10702.1 MAG: ribonuclease P protein component [Candidatus Kentron sp. FM]
MVSGRVCVPSPGVKSSMRGAPKGASVYPLDRTRGIFPKTPPVVTLFANESGSARFPPHLRLRRRRDYARVFANPCRSADAAVTVLGRRNGCAFPRLGLAISKRWLPRAVARNRIKRLIRESFRTHQQQLRGLDVVVISRSAIANVQSADFSRSLERHFQKIRSAAGTGRR